MHDPLVLVARVRRPPITPKEWRQALRLGGGYKCRGWRRLPTILDIWHREPRGRDAFTVCSHHESHWQWHIHHWHLRFWPVFNLRRWLFQPCASCGRRFRYHDARFGYMGTDKTWHRECHDLGHLRKDMLTMTETLNRVFRLYGISSRDQLREIVLNRTNSETSSYSRTCPGDESSAIGSCLAKNGGERRTSTCTLSTARHRDSDD